MPGAADDDTVRLDRRKLPLRRRRPILPWLALGLLVAGAGAAWVAFLRPDPAPPVAIAPVVPPVGISPAPVHAASLADPLAILAARTQQLTLYRVVQNPRIIVFDFASLTEQGRMFNRIAAFIEKKGLPRDRVLDDAELAAAIAAGGETEDTFYYGHNYRLTDVIRFLAQVRRQGVSLNPEEQRLSAILTALGLDASAPEAGLITVPQPVGDVDVAMRQTILRHELSHGEFFTNPAFRSHVATWWRERLSAGERSLITRYLAEGAYDPGIEEVMMNEAMAYIMHTPDPRFFSAEGVGTTDAVLDSLRARFRDGLAPTWLDRVAWPK